MISVNTLASGSSLLSVDSDFYAPYINTGSNPTEFSVSVTKSLPPVPTVLPWHLDANQMLYVTEGATVGLSLTGRPFVAASVTSVSRVLPFKDPELGTPIHILFEPTLVGVGVVLHFTRAGPTKLLVCTEDLPIGTTFQGLEYTWDYLVSAQYGQVAFKSGQKVETTFTIGNRTSLVEEINRSSTDAIIFISAVIPS